MAYQEELAFLRTSNQQLEDRVHSLLQINRDLKLALEDSLAQKNQSLKTYYEGEMERMRKEVGQMKAERERSV